VSGVQLSQNANTATVLLNIAQNAGRLTINASQTPDSGYNLATASNTVDVIGVIPTNPGSVNSGAVLTYYTPSGTTNLLLNMCSTISMSSSNQNSFTMIANVLSNTTIIGLSFANFGFYGFPTNYKLVMNLYKGVGTSSTILATTTITTSGNFNSYNDGSLFIIPFVNGTSFSLATYPITVMPPTISSVIGNSDPNKLAFKTGDTITIQLISTSINNFGAGTNSNGNALAGSILCTGNVPTTGYVYNSGATFGNPTNSPGFLFPTLVGGVSNGGVPNGLILTNFNVPPVWTTLATISWTLSITASMPGVSGTTTIFTLSFNMTSAISNSSPATGYNYLSPPMSLTLDAIQYSPQTAITMISNYGTDFVSGAPINSFPKVPANTQLYISLTNSLVTNFYYQTVQYGTTPIGTLYGIPY
jgi:hypothetical protein